MEHAGAVFELAAADFAGRSLLSDVGGMLHLPFVRFAGARRDALNGLGGRENRLRWLPDDVCGRIFGPAGLRGDAGAGLNDAPGSVLEPPRAVFEPAAADFAARSLLSDVGVMLLPPAAEIPHEVDGGYDGAYPFIGDRPADVVLLPVWRSLGDAAVRAAATAVLERAAERCDERTELRDATAVFVACHEAIVSALAEAA